MKHILLTLVTFVPLFLSGQTNLDTIVSKTLDDVVVKSYRITKIQSKLQDVHGIYLIGRRKNEVLSIHEMPANLAEKTGRISWEI